jgi:hypothetical protein
MNAETMSIRHTLFLPTYIAGPLYPGFLRGGRRMSTLYSVREHDEEAENPEFDN